MKQQKKQKMLRHKIMGYFLPVVLIVCLSLLVLANEISKKLIIEQAEESLLNTTLVSTGLVDMRIENQHSY